MMLVSNNATLPLRRARARLVRADRDRPSSGFSLIELLIAAGLMMVIMIGTIPLFMRSVTDNMAGRESTHATNWSRSRLESVNGLPLDREMYEISGLATARQDHVYWDGDVWVSTPCPDVPAPTCGAPDPTFHPVWEQQLMLRQYNIKRPLDLAPGTVRFFDPADALPGDTEPIFVHVREFGSRVASRKQSGALGQQKAINITQVRGF